MSNDKSYSGVPQEALAIKFWAKSPILDRANPKTCTVYEAARGRYDCNKLSGKYER